MFWRTANALFRPYVRAWWTYSKINWDEIPKPTDEPYVDVTGPDADHVLLVGDGPAMGFGVASHALSLPGQLARQLAQATGRGMSVRAIVDAGLTIRSAEARILAAQFRLYDVVIVMLGASDSACLTSVRAWRRGLHCFIRSVNRGMPKRVELVIVAVPPVSRMPILTGLVAVLAGHHVRLLNKETRTAALGYSNVTFLPFVPPEEPDDNRYRSASTYREWAQQISPTVATVLNRVRASQALDDERLRRLFPDPDRIVGPIAQMYEAVGIAPPWERVWDGTRDVTNEPPESWPWPWNPTGRVPRLGRTPNAQFL